MHNPFNVFEKILNVLALNPKKSFTLEDLANLVIPSGGTLEDSMLIDRTNQAQVLDALIMLDNQGFVVLDSDTDKSFISIKGLININTSCSLN